MIDWEAIREQCIRTGKIIRIDKAKGLTLPPYFHETPMGLSKGELRQFRDERATQSLHIHEFPDYYLAHVDLFNPAHHPIAHGVLDTPGITLAILLGTVTTFFLAKTIHNLDFVPSDTFIDR